MKKKSPSGRRSALAQAALEKLRAEEEREKPAPVASSAGLTPPAFWRDLSGGAIRLIDLERRARFPRVAS